jgi:hypothetical protein
MACVGSDKRRIVQQRCALRLNLLVLVSGDRFKSELPDSFGLERTFWTVFQPVPFHTAGSVDPAIDLIGFAEPVLEPLFTQSN